MMSGISRKLMVFLLLGNWAAAADGAWDERLARTFSVRLREIDAELGTLGPKTSPLPKVPLDDQGGTGGYAGIYASASPAGKSQCAVEVRWKKPAAVEMVALVPARRYDARGLDAQYGLPDDFKVELLDAAGNVAGVVGQEHGARGHPVRRGHPFVYRVSPPVEAVGLRISARQLHEDADGEGSFVHAWAEAMVFEGERNVAAGGEVRSLGGGTPSAPWHWNPSFLVDEQTPLGLPEVPAEPHGNIGWMSEGKADGKVSSSLTVDLGESAMVDGVRLLPAKRPTSDLPSGFGFPKKIRVELGEGDEWREVARLDLRNPGHNPVELRFAPASGRQVRIVAAELWKEFDGYPAFFALSEAEVLSEGKNVALGKPVRSSDGMLNLIAPGGRYWSGAALCDGFGPDGRLVSTREWLTGLDERLEIETRRHELLREAESLVGGWRRGALVVLTILVVVAVFLIIALPIRYRMKANTDLLKVRERIAGDLHDEVGSNLGSIQMFADLAEGRAGPTEELKRIQRIAAETVSAVRDIVWLLRPSGEHRIATVEHLRETASIMVETLDWKFTANEAAWAVELPEDETRHLFLFFREALHNIMRHAKAAKVVIRVEKKERGFHLVIHDDGVGIEVERLGRPATLRALRQRTEALHAELLVDSKPGEGTRLELVVPLEKRRGKGGAAVS